MWCSPHFGSAMHRIVGRTKTECTPSVLAPFDTVPPPEPLTDAGTGRRQCSGYPNNSESEVFAAREPSCTRRTESLSIPVDLSCAHVAVGLRARIWIPVDSCPFMVATVMVWVSTVSNPASRAESHSREWWRQTAPSPVSNTP